MIRAWAMQLGIVVLIIIIAIGAHALLADHV